MAVSQAYTTLWGTCIVFGILPPFNLGLLSDFKICGDSECESPMSRVQAIKDHHGRDCRFLSFRRGDTIYVYHKLTGKREDLWAGSIDKQFGYFPKDVTQEEQVYATMEKVVETQKSDFFCMDEFGYPIDSSHLDSGDDNDDQKIPNQQSGTSQTTPRTDGANAESPSTSADVSTKSPVSEQEADGTSTEPDENKNAGDAGAGAREEAQEAPAALSEQGGSASSAWLGSSVTGWLGLAKQEEPGNLAEGEKKDERTETQAEASFTSSVTGWLGLGGGEKPDDAVGSGEETRGTADSFASTMTGWLGFRGEEKTDRSEEREQDEAEENDEEKEPAEKFRSRRMSLDLEGSQLHEEEGKETGTLDWLGNGLSNTLGFGLTNQKSGHETTTEKEKTREEEEQPASSSWLAIGIGDILGFRKDKSEADESRGSGFKETEEDKTLEEPTGSEYVDTSQSQPALTEEVRTETSNESQVEETPKDQNAPSERDFFTQSDVKLGPDVRSVGEVEEEKKENVVEERAEIPNQIEESTNVSAELGAGGGDHEGERNNAGTAVLHREISTTQSQVSGGAEESSGKSQPFVSVGAAEERNGPISHEGDTLTAHNVETSVGHSHSPALIGNSTETSETHQGELGQEAEVHPGEGSSKGFGSSHSANRSTDIMYENASEEVRRTFPTSESTTQMENNADQDSGSPHMQQGTTPSGVDAHKLKETENDSENNLQPVQTQKETIGSEKHKQGLKSATGSETGTGEVVESKEEEKQGEVEELKEEDKQEDLKEVEEIKPLEKQQEVEEKQEEVKHLKEEEQQQGVEEIKEEGKQEVEELTEEKKQGEIEELKEEEKQEVAEELKGEETQREEDELYEEEERGDIEEIKEERKQEELKEEEKEEEVKELKEEESQQQIEGLKEEKPEAVEELKEEEQEQEVKEIKEEGTHEEVEELKEEKKQGEMEEEKQEVVEELKKEEKQREEEELYEEEERDEIEEIKEERKQEELKEQESQQQIEELKEEKPEAVEELKEEEKREKLQEVQEVKEKVKKEGEEQQVQPSHFEAETGNIDRPESESIEKKAQGGNNLESVFSETQTEKRQTENPQMEEEKRGEESKKQGEVEEVKDEMTEEEAEEKPEVENVEAERRDKEGSLKEEEKRNNDAKAEEEKEELGVKKSSKSYITGKEGVSNNNANGISALNALGANQIGKIEHADNDLLQSGESGPNSLPNQTALGQTAESREDDQLDSREAKNADVSEDNVHRQEDKTEPKGTKTSSNGVFAGQKTERIPSDHEIDTEEMKKKDRNTVGAESRTEGGMEMSLWSSDPAGSQAVISEHPVSQHSSPPRCDGHDQGTAETQSGGAFGLFKNAFSFFSQTKASTETAPRLDSNARGTAEAGDSLTAERELDSLPSSPAPNTGSPLRTKTPSKHHKNLLTYMSADETALLMELFGRHKLQFLDFILGSSETMTDDPDNDESILLDIERLLRYHRETLIAPGIRLAEAPQEAKEQTEKLIALQKLEMLLARLRESFNTGKSGISNTKHQAGASCVGESCPTPSKDNGPATEEESSEKGDSSAGRDNNAPRDDWMRVEKQTDGHLSGGTGKEGLTGEAKGGEEGKRSGEGVSPESRPHSQPASPQPLEGVTKQILDFVHHIADDSATHAGAVRKLLVQVGALSRFQSMAAKWR